ncbi:MAG: signal peptidase II [DPANN group archaeon]|nr:signal peptidase II [DPANN group archaeon]
MSSEKRKRSSFLLVPLTVFAVVIADQLLKYFSVTHLASRPIVVFPFLSLVSTLNTGAAFSFLAGLATSNTLLIFIALIFIGLLIYYHDHFPADPLSQVFYALIMGGALGNLADRLFRAGVVDFISFSFFPAFNLADTALSIGMGGLILLVLRDEFCVWRKRQKTAKSKKKQKQEG